MKVYQAKAEKLIGTDFREVHQKVLIFYKQMKRGSKRKPFIRSAYFKKEKILIDFFWSHLFEKKNWRDRARRLSLFPAAIELIRNSKYEPLSKENPNKRNEVLHRFAGLTKGKDLFYVQIKENKKTGAKRLISVYPAD